MSQIDGIEDDGDEESGYIREAQKALDFHPDNSPFWDSRAGQEAMSVAAEFGLASKTTNAERRELYRAHREYHAREGT